MEMSDTTQNTGEFPILPQHLLHSLESHEFFFTKARKSVDQDSSDLDLLQTEFSSLKDTFFALESKLSVLESLSREDLFDAVSAKSNTQLGVEVSDAKKSLSTVKRDMELVKASLRDIIEDLSKKARELAEVKKDFEEIYSSSMDDENGHHHPFQLEAILDENAASDTFGRVHPNILLLDTEEKCNTVIRAQQTVVHDIENELEIMDKNINDGEIVIKSNHSALIALEKELEEMKIAISSTGPQIEHLQQNIQWFSSVSSLLRTISGIEVDLSSLVLHRSSSASETKSSQSGAGFLRFRLRSILLGPNLVSPSVIITATLSHSQATSNLNTHQTTHAASNSISISNEFQSSSFQLTNLHVSAQNTSTALVVPGLQALTTYALEKQDLRFFILQVQRKVFENAYRTG